MNETDTEKEQFRQHRLLFYALIGQCVTRYQAVEDYLPDLFAAALGGDETKAKAIFAVARGLEAKLDMLSAALLDKSEKHLNRWKELIPGIAAAAAARNKIAHASPTHNAGMLTITLSDDGTPSKMKRIKPARMELRKRTRSGETIWTVEAMREEFGRSDRLLGHLIALAMELRGETPPEHLLR